MHALVYSSGHLSGRWTYVRSRHVVLWELRRVALKGCAEAALLALAAEATPEELLIDR